MRDVLVLKTLYKRTGWVDWVVRWMQEFSSLF
jgi:hypothetical protein